jgi:cobaltochelatase CobN
MRGTEPPASEGWVNVLRRDGEPREVRLLEGQIFVCRGCCCGNVERGIPEVPLEAFKNEWKARGIRQRVHLTITACLGPCAVANVVLLIVHGRAVWLHSIDTLDQVLAIFDYVEKSLAAGKFLPLDERLAPVEFTRYRFGTAGEECAYSTTSR